MVHCERAAHARIVWSCAFSHDDRYFATGSRDKRVRVWRVGSTAGAAETAGSPACVCDSALPVFAAGVTAVAFAPLCARFVPAPESSSSADSSASSPDAAALPCGYLLAIGLEDGAMQLWTGVSTDVTSSDSAPLQWSLAHVWSDGYFSLTLSSILSLFR